MRSSFDRRVVAGSVLELVARAQERVPFHLAGGVALSAAYLAHRRTGDLDLFCHGATEHADLRRLLPSLAAEAGGTFEVVRDAGHLVRARLGTRDARVEVDIVHEPSADLEAPLMLEGVAVESLTDLRAAKLTCLLSRSEPRDLVDVLFLDRAGHRPEDDLELALRKDAGIDPGVLAWLLHQFPCEPMPEMLLPLSVDELRRYRDELAERLRRLTIGES